MNTPSVSVSDLKARLKQHGFVYLASEDVADLTTNLLWHPIHKEVARVWEWRDEGRVRFLPLTAEQAVSRLTALLRVSGVEARRAHVLATAKVTKILEETTHAKESPILIPSRGVSRRPASRQRQGQRPQ